MKHRLTTMAVVVGLLWGCGGDKQHTPTVLVQTPEHDGGADPSGIDEIVKRDALKALEVLHLAMDAGDRDAAALAAVYSIRLRLKHDREKAERALVGGIGSDQLLVRTLCWRWLAQTDRPELPPYNETVSDDDPVVRFFAAVAWARRGTTLPGPLKDAFAAPFGKPEGEEIDPGRRIGRLSRLCAPFDSRVLALAVVAAEARSGGWLESESADKKSPAWLYPGLAKKLITLMTKDNPDVHGLLKAPPRDDHVWFPGGLLNILDKPINGQPLAMLRSASFRSDSSSLRTDALRALTVVSVNPESGDLGAAAAAMESDDPEVRVEAARTYLLLTARATN